MKRNIVILILLLICSFTNVKAVNAYPFPIKLNQPDGSVITVLLKGDEHFKWTESADGFLIKRNSKGVFEYANLSINGDIVLSGIKVNDIEKRTIKELEFVQTIAKTKLFKKLSIDRNNIISQIKDSLFQPQTKGIAQKNVIGNKKILCILIGFKDKAFVKTQPDFYNLMNQEGYNVGTAKGSVRDYYRENSYNQLNLDVTVVGPYIADHNMSYYGENTADGNDIRPRDLIREALIKANSDVNYADFDNDNDGEVDGVHIIYAGYSEAAGASSETIWPHKWSISEVMDGKRISTYSCSSELRYTYGNYLASIGTICHELGHVFGSPDFYDVNYSIDGQFYGTGNWDLMASGSWNDGGDCPAHHNPYTKTQIFNWAIAQELPEDNTLISLYPSQGNKNSFYRMNTKTPDEYFLIENRQRLGFDSALPGHGMMIYHVHSQIASDIYAINTNYLQKLYPVCASATQNPNNEPNSYGEINYSGCPFPGSSNKISFASSTIPSAISWAGMQTEKNLHFITEMSNNVTFVTNPQITGPSQLYNQTIYEIKNLPIGATVQWEFSDNIKVVTTNNNSCTVIKESSSESGDGWLSATIKVSNANELTLKKDVWIEGVPNPEYIYIEKLGDNGYLCSDIPDPNEGIARWKGKGPNNILEFEWKIFSTDAWTIIEHPMVIPGKNPEMYAVQFVPPFSISNQSVGVVLRARNIYGWGRWKEPAITLDIRSCGFGTNSYFSLFPNPASDNVAVLLNSDSYNTDILAMKASTNSVAETNVYEIQLWNMTNLIRTFKSKESITRIQLNGLPNGIYFIHVIKDGKIYKQKLIINKK